MNKESYVEIPFPVGGLDESGAYHKQSPPTTPDCLNVRAFEPAKGRNRGGQRSGLERFCPVVLNGTNPIQDLNAVTSAGSGPLGSGRIYIHSTDPCHIIDNQGNLVFRHGQAGPSNGQACFDTEDNLYQTSVGETSSPYSPLAVRKFDPEGNLLWTRVLFSADATSVRQTLGLGIAKDILYVCGVVTNTLYIWRLDPRTGIPLDAGTYSSWVTPSTLITWRRIGTIINDYNRQFAVGPTRMAIACPHSDGATGSQIQILDHTGTQVAAPAVLTAGVKPSVEDLEVDESGNVYVCYASTDTGSGTSDRLRKYSNAQVAAWTISGTYVTSVAWDSVYQLLYVAGQTVNAAGGNAYAISASDGTNVLAATVGSNAYLEMVRADGRGQYWFGYSIDGAGVFYLVDNTLATAAETLTLNPSASYWTAASNGSSSTKGSAGSQRTTRIIGVSKGTVQAFDRHGVIRVVSGSAALSLVSQVQSAPNSGVLYFVDGTNYKKLTLSTMTVASWTASNGGTIPSNSSDTARLICTWRGRTVLAAIKSDAHNWFMSEVLDPLDYNYGAATTLATQAVAGNNARAGMAPDIVNCLISYSDEFLIFGCDHSIWRMAGDPMDGGTFQKVSDTIGMAWGKPFTMGPDGTVYFYASRGGVFRMAPGGQVERLSQRIDERLQRINLETHRITMAWDDRQQGLHLFITPLTPALATHWFWDGRQGGWWPDQFANKDFNPLCTYTFDGDDPDDRAVLLGSMDGFVRFLNIDAKSDDVGRGITPTAINSYIMLGPLQMKGNEGLILKNLDGALDASSDPVNWSLHVGNTEQAALTAAAASSGTLRAGRFPSQPCRRAGTAVFVKLANAEADKAWQLEWLAGAVKGTGRIRQRAVP